MWFEAGYFEVWSGEGQLKTRTASFTGWSFSAEIVVRAAGEQFAQPLVLLPVWTEKKEESSFLPVASFCGFPSRAGVAWKDFEFCFSLDMQICVAEYW